MNRLVAARGAGEIRLYEPFADAKVSVHPYPPQSYSREVRHRTSTGIRNMDVYVGRMSHIRQEFRAARVEPWAHETHARDTRDSRSPAAMSHADGGATAQGSATVQLRAAASGC